MTDVQATQIDKKQNKLNIKKKSKGCKALCIEYGRAVKLLFSNFVAVMTIFGCMFRLIETAAISIQQDNFFSVYVKLYRHPNEEEISGHPYGSKFDDHYQDLYAGIMSVASFLAALLANLMSGVIISHFEKKSEMTIPLICVIKAAIDIPFCLMSYMQVTNFPLYMAGNILQLLLAKGWT